MAAATGECLANAAEHGGVDRVNLYVESDGGGAVLVIVRDRGIGFAPDEVERRGLDHSVRDRLAGIDGSFEISSAPGAGTEVRLRVVERPGTSTKARSEAHG